MTIILAGVIRIDPERRAALLPHLRAQMEASRQEPGCLDFALTEDPLVPGVIRVFEHFADKAALEHHQGTPHMATWRAACAALGTYGRDLSSFDVSDYRKI